MVDHFFVRNWFILVPNRHGDSTWLGQIFTDWTKRPSCLIILLTWTPIGLGWWGFYIYRLLEQSCAFSTELNTGPMHLLRYGYTVTPKLHSCCWILKGGFIMSGFCRVISLKNAAYFGRLSYEFAFADFLTPLALRRAGGVFCVRILEAIAQCQVTPQ